MTAKKVLIHRWFEEVWNRKRREAIFEMLHPDAVIYGLAEAPTAALKGPLAFMPFWESFISAFPNIQVSVESTMAEDDKVMARCSVRGIHTGFGLGIEPTMRPIAITGICVSHIKDGLLYEAWNSFDFLTLYQQLGVISLPKVPTAGRSRVSSV
jgi:predicted ester cyclase